MSVSPFHPQFIIVQMMADKMLDYRALHEAWKSTAESMTTIVWQRLTTKREANEALLDTDNIITITTSDHPPSNYSYVFHDEDDDDEDATIDFGNTTAKIEYADRHPPCPHAVQRKDMKQNRYNPSIHSPINTTASKYLFHVVVAGGGVSNGHVDIKATYQHQLSLRIDEESCSLNLDCFEYKPTCIDILNGGEDPPPTMGELNAFDNLIITAGRGNSDENDPELLQEGEDYHAAWEEDGNDFVMTHYKALCGKFLNSRVFRLRIALSNVKGIRLIATPNNRSERDGSAVLILEIKDPLTLRQDSFAVRTVRSRLNNDDAFSLCPDWLPGDDTGSKATRFYFYGSLHEMKQTAGYISRICPKVARMYKGEESNSLALAPGVVSVDYASAPSHNPNNMVGVSSLTYDKPFPPPSAWDGAIDSAWEVFEKFLAREEDPMKRMMIRMMTAGPESVIAINQNPNSSPEDVMISSLVGQQFLRMGGRDGVLGRLDNGDSEECIIS